MHCNEYKTDLEDLLLEPETFSATARGERAVRHVEGCAACREELNSLRSTMDLLDAWQTPPISPYFDTRMSQALREEAASAPAGWLERLRTRWSLGANHLLKPAMAAFAALAVVVGGATYTGVSFWEQPNAPVQESATIRDLQSLDGNQQAIDALQVLDQDDQADSGSATQ